MRQIPETCEFEIESSKLDLETTVNGDIIIIKPNMNREAAAALAWLNNTDNHLIVEIKMKPE